MKIWGKRTVGTKSGDSRRYLCFSLSGAQYAMPLLSVKEVIAMPEIKPIPQTPSYFLGITNLRGQIIPVIDLKLKLGIPAQREEGACVIICDLAPHTVGLAVSSVNHVLALSPDEIGPRPDGQGSQKQNYITGLAKLDSGMLMLIDLAASLDIADRTAFDHSTDGSQAA